MVYLLHYIDESNCPLFFVHGLQSCSYPTYRVH